MKASVIRRYCHAAVIKLICVVKRKPGMSPEEFHRYWREVHGPLIASTRSGSHVVRYEQNPRPLSSYASDPGGYDGVTIQWFESEASFRASLAEDDYRLIDEDLPKFLDVPSLVFLLTEGEHVVF